MKSFPVEPIEGEIPAFLIKGDGSSEVNEIEKMAFKRVFDRIHSRLRISCQITFYVRTYVHVHMYVCNVPYLPTYNCPIHTPT